MYMYTFVAANRSHGNFGVYLYLILDGVISLLDLFFEPLNVCLERRDDVVSLLQFLLLALYLIPKTLNLILKTPNLQAIKHVQHSLHTLQRFIVELSAPRRYYKNVLVTDSTPRTVNIIFKQ